MDSSVEDFAKQVFDGSPGNPGSMSLDIDVETPSEFFEVLLIIMTYGMKKWYGERINISDVSADHMILLQKYFLSFGVVLHVDKKDEPAVYVLNNKAYLEQDSLDKMTFTVATGGSLFTVRFTFAPGAAPKWI
jgi:hypothetical protein